MNALAIAIIAIVLTGCGTIAPVEATTPGFAAAGWHPGDPYSLDLFCVSKEGAESLAEHFSKEGSIPNPVPPGCLNLGVQVPFVLVERYEKHVDWEGDAFYLWRVREFYRTDIYVLLWERPELPIPPQMIAI